MKTRIVFLSLCLLHVSAIGQELMDVALKGQSSIILSEPYIIILKEDPFSINKYLYYLNHSGTVVTDTSLIKSLVELSKFQDTTEWQLKEFNKRIVINPGDYIHQKKVINQLSPLNDFELKEIKTEIRKYNNRSNDWRRFPIRVSRPIFSDDNNFALIGIIRGNEGSEISLFKYSDSSWIHLGYLERKAF